MGRPEKRNAVKRPASQLETRVEILLIAEVALTAQTGRSALSRLFRAHGYRELLTTLRPSSFEDRPPVFCLHPGAKTMPSLPTNSARLICSLHPERSLTNKIAPSRDSFRNLAGLYLKFGSTVFSNLPRRYLDPATGAGYRCPWAPVNAPILEEKPARRLLRSDRILTF